MASETPDTPAAPPPLWRYVGLHEYARPVEPAKETVRKGLRGLWARLRGASADDVPAAQGDLRSAPDWMLNQAAPGPDWDEPAAALNTALEDWLGAAGPTPPLQMIVDGPHSGTARVLTAWAEAHDWPVLAAPTPEQILAGESDGLARLAEDADAPVVVPRLERWYLRHHAGLGVIRDLLDRLHARPGRSLVGCDSWAYAYLTQTGQVDPGLPPPITLRAFDHDDLQRWFLELAARAEGRTLVFRQADTGRHVLLRPRDTEGNGAAGSTSCEVTPFLRHVAEHSRGLPEIAWAIWRHSLRFAADEDVGKEAQEAAFHDRGGTIWVKPWHQLDLPALPPRTRRIQLFVLHAVLLHGGLPAALLAEVVPFTPTEILHGWHRLRASGLAEDVAGRCRVTPLGYPAVRQSLNSEGYMVDAF